MNKPIFESSEWNFELLQRVTEELEKIFQKEIGFDLYKNQIEIISSDQMLDAYSSHGMPIYWNHWSFGKHFVQSEKAYRTGKMGLAYEIVLNTQPCIAYLMEENTMTMQTLVIAHACFGHNSFFKNNYLFKQWTDAESIIDYLVFAKKYIRSCEEKYGVEEVELVLDSAHSIMNFGVDKYRRPTKLSLVKEKEKQQQRELELQKQINELWNTLPNSKNDQEKEKDDIFPKDPEENLMYFIEKYSPTLDTWKREILRIVRKISQYFYPQRQCITGNHLVSTKNGLFRLDELIKDEGYINKEFDFQLLSLNDKFVDISHTYKKKTKVSRIKTKSGKTFTGTKDHPLMVFDGKDSYLKDLGNIQLGDSIVVNLNYKNSFSSSDAILFENTFSNRKSSASKYPTTVNSDYAQLLAFMLVTEKNEGKFEFSSKNLELIYRFNSLLNETFGYKTANIIEILNGHSLIFKSEEILSFIEQTSPDALNSNLSIPFVIRTSSRDTIISFIKQIVDLMAINRTSTSKFEIVADNTNLEFLEHLQTLLICLGIMSEISEIVDSSEKDKIHLSFRIHQNFESLFENIIGSDLIEHSSNVTSYQSINSDRHYLLCIDENRYQDTNVNFFNLNYEFSEISNAKQPISNIDIFYDTVVDIQEVEEEMYVYDVTIPENHLFWVDGVISHNTKIANEGWASFVHHLLMNKMWENNLITDGSMIEFIASHTSVVFQPTYEKRYYSGMNPYALGFAIFDDVRRICTNPTEEDKEWFPHLINQNWTEVVKDIVVNYRDESMIKQFLSPKVMRDWRMFKVSDDNSKNHYEISKIHNERGYREIRDQLSKESLISSMIPDIQVWKVNLKGDRTLFLKHFVSDNILLSETTTEEVLKHIARLWGYSVKLISVDSVTGTELKVYDVKI